MKKNLYKWLAFILGVAVVLSDNLFFARADDMTVLSIEDDAVSDNSCVEEYEEELSAESMAGDEEVTDLGFSYARDNMLAEDLANRDAKYGKIFSMTSVDIGTWRFAQTYARTEIFPALNAARVDPKNQWYNVTKNGVTTRYTTNVTEPFIYDYDLEKIAMQRVFEMGFHRAHTRPDGTTCLNAWRGSINFDSNGQNELEGGGSDALDVVKGFMEEDGKSAQAHRIAILGAENRRDYIGIGCIYHDGYYIVCIEMSDGKEYIYGNPLPSERLNPTPAVDTYKDMTVTFARGYSGLGNADYGNSTFTLLGVPAFLKMNLGDLYDPSEAYFGTSIIALGKVKDRNDITWKSENPDVIVIENGKFKAVGAGRAKIIGCIGAFKYSSEGTTVSILEIQQSDGCLIQKQIEVVAPTIKTEQPSFITDTYRNWDGKIDSSVLATNDYFDFNPVGNYIGSLSVSIDQKPSGADAYVSVLNETVRFKKGCPAGSYRIRYDVSGSDTVGAKTEYMTVSYPICRQR